MMWGGVPVEVTAGSVGLWMCRVEKARGLSELRGGGKASSSRQQFRGEGSCYWPRCMGMMTWVNPSPPTGRMTPGLEGVVVSRLT